MARNYTNSVSGMVGVLPRACPECSAPRCEGPDRLRIFANWNDLAAHLSEAMIVHAVNRLVEIGEEYMVLKAAAEVHLAHLAEKTEETAFLLAAARKLTPQQRLELRGEAEDGRVTIVTQPMRSRAAGKGGR